MLLTPEQTRQLLEHAARNHYAILAVNADSPAAMVDVLEAARRCAAPVIIETSLWQLKGHSFGCGDALIGMARYIMNLALLANHDPFRDVPVAYHTDHIKGPETESLLTAAIRGIPVGMFGQILAVCASSISLDSSDLSDDENIALMSTLCEEAERGGKCATLEMEAGVDQGVTPPEVTRTVFGAVEKTHPGHLALWAPGVGTEHGLAPGNQVDPDAIRRHHELASELCGRPIGIALHGSSGLSPDALQEAVAAGTAKVNWSSESLLLRSQAAKRYFHEHGDALEKGHPHFKETAMDNGLQSFIADRYIPVVCERIKLLGGANQAQHLVQE